MNESPSERNPVEALAEEFLERYRRGERPPLTEYTDKHPALAGEIRDLFPALLMMEDVRPGGEDATGAYGPETSIVEGRKLERVGDYRILREVGRGGMGIVYEAEQESLGRHVALKVLPAHSLLDPQRLRRFQREAKAAARLHHTNIVPVFGVGEDEGLHYYVMQFIQGQGLDEVLVELRRLRQAKSTPGSRVPAARQQELSSRVQNASEVAQGLLTGKFIASPTEASAPSPLSPWGRGDGGEGLTVPPPSGPEPAVLPQGEREKALSDSGIHLPGQPAHTTLSDSGREYWQSVARIGIQVAEALTYAHNQGTLHRDIKPSNLLLDNQGSVWITDFGLAKAVESDDLTRTGDIVGTIRYMAPERFQGKSDARSDVYGLGLTLYELLTLHPAFDESDRVRLVQRVTQLDPPSPRRLNRRLPRDLETVVLKAIAKHPADRYQTAAELAEDLGRFLTDRPIRARRTPLRERAWRWCRRNPIVAGLTVSVAVLLVSVALVSSVMAWWLRQERNATQAQLELKVKAEAKATRRLFESLVTQARASRLTGRVGQRFESLEALREAAELLPTLHLEPKAVLDLRNDAIACMVLPDLRLVKPSWNGNPQGNSGITFDANLERYARTDGQGNISIRRVDDDQEIMNLPGPGEPAWIVRFSPNGQYLAAKYHHGNTAYSNQCWVWDWKRREKVFTAPSPIAGIDFSPDSHWLAIGFLSGELNVYDLTSEKKEFIGFPRGPIAEYFAFHPDGQKLAIARSQSVVLWDLKTGKVDQLFRLPGNVRGTAWHPEGKLLAAGCDKDNAIHVWNAFTGQPQAELKGHQGGGVGCVFNHAGDVLVSNGWDGTIRLWDPWTGHQLLTSGQGGLQFSRDDRLTGCFMGGSRVGLWEVALGRECGKLAAALEVGKGPWSVEFSSNGRLLASGHEDGVRLWDLASWREAAQLSLPPTPHSLTAIFAPDGRNLITAARNGVYRWPIKWALRQGEAPAEPLTAGDSAGASPSHRLEVGPPRLLGDMAGSDIWRASLSGNGTMVALADHSRQKAIVLDIESKPNKVLLHYPHPGIANIAISPDGQWVASAPWGDSSGTVRVFEIRNQKHVKDFLEPNTSNSVRFSPDSQWLVIGNRLWQTGSWKAGPLIEGTQTGELPRPLAFSSDGMILASAAGGPSSQPVRLVDPSTGREFATLSVPYPEWVLWLCFSPDGSQLAACCSGHGIRVWDLRAIRQQLAEMGLDWDLPPYAPAEPLAAAKPLKVKVLAGN